MRRDVRSINGALAYLASDLLGSASVALDASGTPTASQLYAPYGGVRYTNGTMPTDYGFTGQRADATTGLDYYGARYYDPTVGQFTSADTVLAGGLNRYGYVGGNPTTFTDPSGHLIPSEEMSGAPEGLRDGSAPENWQRGGANDGPGGGGGGIPLPDPGPLLKWILGGVVAVEGALGELTTIPTAQAPGYTPTAGGVDDSDYWNMRTAPHATPSASSPGGGTHGGGGSGGRNGGQPQGQPGTGEDTAAPEPEPQPSTAGAMQGGGPRDPCDAVVRYLAQCVHTRQMTVFGGRGAGIPCAGSCAIRGTLGGVPVDIELGPYTGVNPVGTHAEVQEYQDVANILLTFAAPGDALTVDFVNAYKPCPAFCQGRIASNLWNQNLQTAAGPGVDLTINWWRVNDSGSVMPALEP